MNFPLYILLRDLLVCVIICYYDKWLPQQEVYKRRLNNIFRWLEVLVCSLKESGAQEIGCENGTWISQKMQKKKVLEELVPLQKHYL